MISQTEQVVNMPHNSDAEMSCIGCCLLSPNAFEVASSMIDEKAFFEDRHRKIWRALSSQRDSDKGVDVVTLAHSLDRLGWLDEVGGPAYLNQIMGSVPHAENADYYTKIVAENHQRRWYITAARDVIESSCDITQDMGNITQEIESILQPISLGNKQRSQILTYSEMVEQYPRLNKPIIAGLLREEETANLIASTKVGKTWLAHDLALSVATGTYWLGKFPTTQGKALIIDYELHGSTLIDRTKTVANARTIQASDINDNLMMLTLRKNWRSINELSQVIRGNDFKLIIIDALYRAIPPGTSENDNGAITQIYNTVDALAAENNCAVVCVHHSSKGDQSDKSVTDVGSGAGSQSRAVDCHMVIRPHEEAECAVLDAAVRSFAPVDPVVLRWNFPLWSIDMDLDPLALKRPQSKSETKQAAKDREGYKDIRAIFKENQTTELTRGQLRKGVGGNRDRVDRLIRGMLNDEELTHLRTEKLPNGHETEVYKWDPTKGPDDPTSDV